MGKHFLSPTPSFSQRDVARWTNSQAVSVASTFVPDALRLRLIRIAAELEGQENVSAALRQRNELIQLHDRQFYSAIASKTLRAKQIARDLRDAATVINPSTPALASASAILRVARGKTLKFKQIMNIIS